jgi:hypothetical protein
LKKAAQKFLLLWACGAETAGSKLLKFFASFCSQKEALSSPAASAGLAVLV